MWTPFHIKCNLILRNVGHHVDHIETAEKFNNGLFLLAGTLPSAPQISHLLEKLFSCRASRLGADSCISAVNLDLLSFFRDENRLRSALTAAS